MEKQTFLFLVDGREKDANYLEQLDPLSVDKVEVISQPTAKYEGSVSGIINIILKKDKRVGFSGSFNGNLPTSKEALISGGRLNMEYGFGKFRLYLSGGGYKESFDTENSVNRILHTQPTDSTVSSTVIFQSASKGTGKYWGMYPTIGIDYFINDKNMLNFSSILNSSRSNGNSEDQSFLKNNSTKYYFKNNTSEDKNSSQYYSLFYKKTFAKPGHEVTVDLTFNQNGGKGNSIFNEGLYTDSSGIKIKQPSVLHGTSQTFNRKSYKGKMDYALPIFTNYKFETGGQYYLQDINNSSSALGDINNSSSALGDVKDSLFNYTEAGMLGMASLAENMVSLTDWQDFGLNMP